MSEQQGGPLTRRLLAGDVMVITSARYTQRPYRPHSAKTPMRLRGAHILLDFEERAQGGICLAVISTWCVQR